MPTVTIELRRNRREDVDTGTLTPKARALVDALPTLGGAKVFASIGILLRSTRPLRDMPAGRVPGIDTWYTPAELDATDLMTWSSWSVYPPDSTMPASVYVESQAARLPIDYWPVPDKDAPIPGYAVGADELLTRVRVLDVLRHLGHPVAVGTWDSYVSRGKAPRPDEYVERTPRWRMSTITAWAATRPGQGARTDLAGGNQ
jgi:hypothetical protein